MQGLSSPTRDQTVPSTVKARKPESLECQGIPEMVSSNVFLYLSKLHKRRDLVHPVAQLVKNPPAMQETWVRSLGWEDPLERKMPPTPGFWPGEFHGLYSPWGCKESDTTEQFSPLYAAAATAAKSLQSCPTLCDPIESSPPGSSTHGIFQARVLEWGAIAFSITTVYPTPNRALH